MADKIANKMSQSSEKAWYGLSHFKVALIPFANTYVIGESGEVSTNPSKQSCYYIFVRVSTLDKRFY